MKNYLLFKLHWHFFLQKHSSVDERIGKCSISKGRSWECFSLALGSRYPYKADNSNRLSWISTCSFWPSRRHYWVFHSFQSETASMFNSSSQNLSKPYCYLINICAWFPGQLLVLRAVIKPPSADAVPLRWNIWMRENNMSNHFFILSALLILFPT